MFYIAICGCICASSKATKKLHLYGIKQPLRVAGTFTADVLVGNRVLMRLNLLLYRVSDIPFWSGRQLLLLVC